MQHFTDHSQTLPKALAQANDRAWQAVSIALAGDGFLDQIKVFFASSDDKGIREQVRLFLQDKSIGFEEHRLISARNAWPNSSGKKGRIADAHALAPNDVAQRAADFRRYADPKGMVDGAEQVIGQIADEFASHYPNLAKLLRQRPQGAAAAGIGLLIFLPS